jgi:kinesin family member 2/24
VSCFEIYGGKLYDLLHDRHPIKCLEDGKGVVQTPGLKEIVVDDVEALLLLMASANQHRMTGTTGANEESSRSHQILQLRVKHVIVDRAMKRKNPNEIGQFSFIDLAGSEKGSDTNHNSKQRSMEGAEINTSLLALKEVIRSLEKKQGHTSFRFYYP